MVAEADKPGARVVLLTGAAGRLGTATIDSLRAQGWIVRALRHRREVPGADQVAPGSLEDPRSLLAAAAGACAVVHLAGITHARRPSVYEEGNLGGTRRLLEAAGAAGVRRFVYVSSRTAVAGAGGYGESKLAAESAAAAADIETVILRPAEVYAAGGREGIDEIVSRARRGVPIPLVGGGEDIVCPLHLDDLAPAIARAASAPAAAGGTYVLGGECVSLRDFAVACRTAFSSSSRIVGIPLPLAAAAARASRILPLPLYPDQVMRLRAAKPGPSAAAGPDLGFAPRPLREGLTPC